MATQYDPIAKDESLNTTELSPRNIADVLAEELSGIASALTPTQLSALADVTITSAQDGQTLKYDAVSQKWVNANDAGGHTIENPSGTSMTQRANLQFTGDGVTVTDDSANDRTVIDVSPDAGDIAYDNSNSGLSATRVQGAIDEVNAKVDRGSVSVTADGVKTNGQLYAELYSQIDIAKATRQSILMIGTQVWTLKSLTATYLTFSRLNTGSTGGNIIELTISNNPARYAVVFTTQPSVSVLDEIATVPTNGTVITLYY